MRYIAHICVTLIQCAVISLVIAVAFGGLRYIGYLLSWVEKPTLVNILGMALILWAIMLLRGVISVIAFMYHCWKDPYFKQATFQTELAGKNINALKKLNDMDGNKDLIVVS